MKANGRFLILSALICALLFAFAACGDSNPSGNPGSNTDSPNTGGRPDFGGVSGGVDHDFGTISYALNDDGESYTVSYISYMASDVVIPSTYEGKPVTGISTYAFYGLPNIKTVTIPSSVTTISNNAFEGCTSLESINIPNSVTYIGWSAFDGCNNLKYNEFDNAYYLGNETNPYVILIKAKNTSVTYCEIHNGTKFIYDEAFSGCTSLANITIPDNVISIGENAFYGCPIENASIPTSAIDCIQKSALKTVIITSGDSIDTRAFNDCTNLTSITIGNSVTSIGDSAFYSCTNLTSITIPSRATLPSLHPQNNYCTL